MQCCHVRNCQMPRNEIMQTTCMKMNHVKFTGALHNMVHEQDFARQIIRSTLVLAKRTPAYGNQLGACDRVTTGEKSHLMAEANQLFSQVRNDAFRPSVMF